MTVELCAMHGTQMDGEYCAGCERDIAETLNHDKIQAEAAAAVCSVCGIEWVDVLAGQDTCGACSNDG